MKQKLIGLSRRVRKIDDEMEKHAALFKETTDFTDSFFRHLTLVSETYDSLEDRSRWMEELVLKRRVGSGRHHCLSFLSEPDMIPKSNFTLPFYDPNCLFNCSSCRGLFYSNDCVGNDVVCNLTTNEFKLLTPQSEDCFCGLGYDPKSDDYKVIRNHKSYCTTEVFSFKSDSWKVIPGPGPGDGTVVFAECGVYVDGRCYWVTWTLIDRNVCDILSFDFSDETFYRSPLPPLVEFGSIRLKVRLFDYEGCLSAVGYQRVEDYKNRVAMYFEVHVRRTSWERLFSVILIDVMDDPLGLRNGLLFLRGYTKCHHSPSHLMVYDWVKEELREHAIYEMCPSDMCLLSYVKNEVALPDAKPIHSDKTVLKRKVALGISHSSVLNKCSHSSSGTTVLNKCSHCSSGTVLESKVPPKRCCRRRCLKREQMRNPFMVRRRCLEKRLVVVQ